MTRPVPGIAAPVAPRVSDPEVDRVLRDHTRAITQVITHPALAMRVIEGVELANATDVPVAHGLGRAPRFVTTSCPRNGSTGGDVLEVRSSSVDRRDYVVLRATGYGATVTVDVMVL